MEQDDGCLDWLPVRRETYNMIGAIRAWDIMFHPIVTVQCFGWKIA